MNLSDKEKEQLLGELEHTVNEVRDENDERVDDEQETDQDLVQSDLGMFVIVTAAVAMIVIIMVMVMRIIGLLA